MIELINGDCLKEMDKLIEKGVRVDCIITSPPYNIGEMHSNTQHFGTYAGNDMKECDYQKWQIDFLNKCFELLSDNGSMFYNHKVRIKKGQAIHPLKWIFKTNFVLKQEITWDMGKSANCDKIRFFPFSERIYWLTKNPKTRLYNGDCFSDVWRIVPTHKRKETGHIAVMPEEIPIRCINAIRPTLVFDPFMGSGTTGKVCVDKNISFIGVELEEKSFLNATNRINQAKNDKASSLF